jgi:hypothetical protein
MRIRRLPPRKRGSREFWQPDHLHLYTPDIEHRLRRAGVDVEVIPPADEFDADVFDRARSLPPDRLLLCW